MCCGICTPINRVVWYIVAIERMMASNNIAHTSKHAKQMKIIIDLKWAGNI